MCCLKPLCDISSVGVIPFWCLLVESLSVRYHLLMFKSFFLIGENSTVHCCAWMDSSCISLILAQLGLAAFVMTPWMLQQPFGASYIKSFSTAADPKYCCFLFIQEGHAMYYDRVGTSFWPINAVGPLATLFGFSDDDSLVKRFGVECQIDTPLASSALAESRIGTEGSGRQTRSQALARQQQEVPQTRPKLMKLPAQEERPLFL